MGLPPTRKSAPGGGFIFLRGGGVREGESRKGGGRERSGFAARGALSSKGKKEHNLFFECKRVFLSGRGKRAYRESKKNGAAGHLPSAHSPSCFYQGERSERVGGETRKHAPSTVFGREKNS